jgi:ribosome recycling factor
MNIYLQEKNQDFEAVIDFFQKDIANLRTSRINLSILDNVSVLAYETNNPINALANISLSDASIIISPWDKSVLKNIEKALIEADLGLGVVNEGDKIRLSAPLLTEENRKEIVKKLNEKLESARVSLRQKRDEVKENILSAEESGEISEDEKFRFIKELDEFTNEKNEKLKELREKKEKDIMEI